MASRSSSHTAKSNRKEEGEADDDDDDEIVTTTPTTEVEIMCHRITRMKTWRGVEMSIMKCRHHRIVVVEAIVVDVDIVVAVAVAGVGRRIRLSYRVSPKESSSCHHHHDIVLIIIHHQLWKPRISSSCRSSSSRAVLWPGIRRRIIVDVVGVVDVVSGDEWMWSGV